MLRVSAILISSILAVPGVAFCQAIGSTGGGRLTLKWDLEQPSIAAPVDKIKVYYADKTYLIYAAGMRESDDLEPRIEEIAMDVHPPSFAVRLYGTAGALKIQPYQVLKLFRSDEEDRIKTITIHTAAGAQEVAVEDLPLEMLGNSTVPIITSGNQPLGGADIGSGIAPLLLNPTSKPKNGRVVEGISTSLKFDEAYQDAIAQLKKVDTGVADDRLQTYLVSVRTVHGGIAGAELMVVAVYGIFDSERQD
ncbi:hypothetical protein [Aeoliella sp.]|uniref:hypothetical protein n=1 Tax=Aeoliella sp. TaxID=2795800 RepID=UPI003CCB7E87